MWQLSHHRAARKIVKNPIDGEWQQRCELPGESAADQLRSLRKKRRQAVLDVRHVSTWTFAAHVTCERGMRTENEIKNLPHAAPNYALNSSKQHSGL